MGINTKQIIELIIQPTLKDLGLYSLAAEQLLAGTCAQESGMGTYLAQVPKPIAKGLWQMEDATHDDIQFNFLPSHHDYYLYLKALSYAADKCAENMIYNLKYACAMARIHYLRVKEALPAANDIPALARYYKLYYNTPNGAATEKQFIDNWNKYCASYYAGK